MKTLILIVIFCSSAAIAGGTLILPPTGTVFSGDAGSGGSIGLVPAAPAGSAEAGAYLSAGGTFTSPDQSKPQYNSFSMISQTPNPGGAGIKTGYQNVYISGNHAYGIGSGNPGLTLSIWNIANQAAPYAEGSIATGSVHWTSGTPYFLNGGYNLAIGSGSAAGYIFACSSGSSWIYAINVTNPNNPIMTAGMLVPGTPGSLYDCAYQNGYLYLATQSTGLDVVDVGGGACGGTLSVPTNCYQEGGGVKSFGVKVSGNNLFTTQYTTSVYATRQIKSWTLTGAGSPSAPSLSQSLQVTTVGEALGVSLYGNTAYVTVEKAGTNAYDVIDITTPSAMANLSVITPSYTVNSAFVAVQHGNYVYVPSGSSASNGGAIDMFDISNRSAPFKVATAYTGIASSGFGGIALDGKGFIYAADYGPAPGTSGNLDIFTEPNFVATIGAATIESLTTTPQAFGVTPTCGAAQSGLIKMTSTGLLCSCISSSWVNVGTGLACSF